MNIHNKNWAQYEYSYNLANSRENWAQKKKNSVPAAIFFWGAQFSRKLARLYEYSYLGPVFYMNIHIAHDRKVFVTLRGEKKSNAISIPCP